MLSTLFFSFVGSLIICMALIPPLMAVASRLHVLDVPTDARRLHSDPVPRLVASRSASPRSPAMLVGPQGRHRRGGLLGGVVILLFGMWDDRVSLPYPSSFSVRCWRPCWSCGRDISTSTSFPVLESDIPLWLSYPLTLFVIVGITNAVNLADGLDGLAGGLSLLSCAGMACLAYVHSGNQTVTLLMVPLLGGLLGFLRFNTYPARIFMGDAGSQFLGFFMAVSAIVLTDPEQGPYTPVLGLFLLGLPLLDTAGVMIQRLKEGRSPVRGRSQPPPP